MMQQVPCPRCQQRRQVAFQHAPCFTSSQGIRLGNLNCIIQIILICLSLNSAKVFFFGPSFSRQYGMTIQGPARSGPILRVRRRHRALLLLASDGFPPIDVTWWLPFGYVKIAIENGRLYWIYNDLPIDSMVMFHSSVKLPEGKCERFPCEMGDSSFQGSLGFEIHCSYFFINIVHQ